jgi:hypothetical protein
LPYRLALEHPETIHVAPERAFFAYDWTPAGLRSLFEGRGPIPEGIHSMHLWAHLWWSRDRQDFSRFHAGRLTPAYVRHADTPYARLARPFLPSDLPGQDRDTWRREQAAWAIEDARGWWRRTAQRSRRLVGLGRAPHG